MRKRITLASFKRYTKKLCMLEQRFYGKPISAGEERHILALCNNGDFIGRLSIQNELIRAHNVFIDIGSFQYEVSEDGTESHLSFVVYKDKDHSDGTQLSDLDNRMFVIGGMVTAVRNMGHDVEEKDYEFYIVAYPLFDRGSNLLLED